MSTPSHSSAWHRAWFDEDYLRLYQHRDPAEARAFIQRLRRQDLLPPPRPGGVLLDLCCGAGRHSHELAAQGYRVVGLDWSPHLLQAARADGRGANPCWVRGDLAHLPLTGGADAVLSLFTSLGYLEDDAANTEIWRRLLELPRPGGRVVLDYLNPQAVRQGLVARSERRAGAWLVHEERRIDESLRMVEKTLRFGPPGRPPRLVTERVKLYEPDWFLERAGDCRRLAHWGDLAGGPWRPESPRSVLVLERPA